LSEKSTALHRTVSAPMLALYGMGNILGAGIYVLVGKVAGVSGYAAPYAFALAALVASFTGLSYARLSSRFPKSAGEANYALIAFGQQWLALLIGLAIILSGVVSSAAILHGFAAYLQVFVTVWDELAMSLALFVLAVVAAWGIKQSIWLTASLTVIEVFGLLYVLLVAWPEPTVASEVMLHAHVDMSSLGLALFGGAFVAFYAYVGFEDIVNIAEEVKEPQRALPRAIMIALLSTTIIYVLIAFVAVARVSPSALSESNAPLALIYQSASGGKAYGISFIALFAVINGALVNLIMCARVVYGMAGANLLPQVFARVNPKTRTPIVATVFVTGLIWLLAVTLPLLSLAKITSFVLLLVFSVVNASCWVVMTREPGSTIWAKLMPLIGFLTCIGLMAVPVLDWLG